VLNANVMLHHPTQPTLANVFQLLEHVKMNMVEKWVLTFGFNKENLRNASTPSAQQLHG